MNCQFVFLLLLSLLSFSAVNASSTSPLEGNELTETHPKEETPRELSDIQIEVEKPKKAKARNLRGAYTNQIKRKIGKLIQNFNLDSDFDDKQINKYFKKLEDSIYTDMKKSLYKQKTYVKSYGDVIQEYQKLVDLYPSVN